MANHSSQDTGMNGKGFWYNRFSYLENYSNFVEHDNPLPSWCNADVQAFIAMAHGPTLRAARDVVKCTALEVLLEQSQLQVAWKYSKSPHGTVLALGAGAVFGWTFGHEVANHALQLYTLDTMSATQRKPKSWNDGRPNLRVLLRYAAV